MTRVRYYYVIAAIQIAVAGHVHRKVTKEPYTNAVWSKFATKTTYLNRAPISDAIPWKKHPTYLPIAIHAVLRHGTRYPGEEWSNKLKAVLPKIKDHLINSPTVSSNIKRLLKRWEYTFPDNSFNSLIKRGCEEHAHLGRWYFSLAPKLWNKPGISVISSTKDRAWKSAVSFLQAVEQLTYNRTFTLQALCPENLVLVNRSFLSSVNIEKGDALMRFWENCPKYTKSVAKNDTAKQEYEKYFKTVRFQNVVKRIFPGMEDITGKELYSLYQLCAFERASLNDSVWCQLFQEENFDVFEYGSDIEHFYKTGYGHSINYEQSCVLLEDILDKLKNKSSKITLRFGHAETLIPLVSLLGFFEEEVPLLADNYDEKVNRRFKTAEMSPFAGNLAIVLYRSHSPPFKQYISFVLNEYILKPFGLDCYYCEYEEGSDAYIEMHKRIQNCGTVCDAAKMETELGIAEQLNDAVCLPPIYSSTLI